MTKCAGCDRAFDGSGWFCRWCTPDRILRSLIRCDHPQNPRIGQYLANWVNTDPAAVKTLTRVFLDLARLAVPEPRKPYLLPRGSDASPKQILWARQMAAEAAKAVFGADWVKSVTVEEAPDTDPRYSHYVIVTGSTLATSNKFFELLGTKSISAKILVTIADLVKGEVPVSRLK